MRSVEERTAMAERGREVIARLVDHIDIKRIVDDMSRLKDFEDDVMKRCPWVPAAFNGR